MRKRIWGFFVFLVSIHTTTMALGASIGTLSYGGEGCPQGSVNASMGGQSLQITFSTNRALAGISTGRTNASATCSVNVPIRMTPNTQASIQEIQATGYNRLPQGAGSQISVEHFFAGGRGPQVSRSFAGMLNEQFRLADQARPQTKIWSPCGQEAVLRINTTLQVSNNGRQQDAVVGLDQGGLYYAIEYRQCR
jgi:hypothetical protein